MKKSFIEDKIINRVVEELFELAKNLGEFMEEIVFTPYGKLRITSIPRTTYYRKLERFETHGLVKKVRKRYGSEFVITEKAKRLRKSHRIKKLRPDGLSTVVMFDIPEEKHKSRDNFRRYLLKNGYTQIQKSVFISPFQVFSELKEFAQELKIEKNVSVIVGKLEQFI